MIKKIFFIYLFISIMSQSCKNDKQEQDYILNKSYVNINEAMTNRHEHPFDKKFYQTIGAQFLLDTLSNKNQEEFILIYHNSGWRDTISNNFTTKIVYDKIKKQWLFYRIDYINYPFSLSKTRFKKELKSDIGIENKYTYYNEVTNGILNNRVIIDFLNDSLYSYKDRTFGYNGLTGYRPLGHFKYIDDTLKYREYDLGYFQDEKGKILERLVTLIKEETSK